MGGNMPSVTVNLPNRPVGSKVEIPYLGEFENSSTTEVNQEKWERFCKYQPGASEYLESGHLTVAPKIAKPQEDDNLERAKIKTEQEPASVPGVDVKSENDTLDDFKE
jgi:hypothetical protein